MAITLQESLRGLFYAPFYVALAHDAYAAEGVEVRFVSSPQPGDAAVNVMNGAVDVCWGGPMRVMQAYQQIPGCDLVCFAEVVTRDPFLLVGRKPRPDFSLGDLLGLRIATVSEVPTPWMCLQEDLRRAGIDPSRLSRVADRTMAQNVASLERGAEAISAYFENLPAAVLAHACTRYKRLKIWGRDPRLPRAGYDRLRASLVSGGFVSPGTDYEIAVDNSLADEVMRRETDAARNSR
jgi:NitT/TauT family transport system substrate-binding protein